MKYYNEIFVYMNVFYNEKMILMNEILSLCMLGSGLFGRPKPEEEGRKE
jgi:hypothetical protein